MVVGDTTLNPILVLLLYTNSVATLILAYIVVLTVITLCALHELSSVPWTHAFRTAHIPPALLSTASTAVNHGIHVMANLLTLVDSDAIFMISLIVASSKNLPIAYPFPPFLVHSALCLAGVAYLVYCLLALPFSIRITGIHFLVPFFGASLGRVCLPILAPELVRVCLPILAPKLYQFDCHI
jgi:hypothetical protein